MRGVGSVRGHAAATRRARNEPAPAWLELWDFSRPPVGPKLQYRTEFTLSISAHVGKPITAPLGEVYSCRAEKLGRWD